MQRKFTLRNAPARGFTLIELIVVIVILGILAATALPRFMDLRGDAAVASLRGIEGAVRSASQMANAKCQLVSTCNPGLQSSQALIDGRSMWMIYGWPEAGDRLGQDQIDMLINSSGFTVSLPDGRTHRWTLTSAQSPSQCYVDYQHPLTAGALPAITTVTTGC